MPSLSSTDSPPQQSCYGVDTSSSPRPSYGGGGPEGRRGKAAIEILPSLTSDPEESRLWLSPSVPCGDTSPDQALFTAPQGEGLEMCPLRSSFAGEDSPPFIKRH